MRTLRLVVAQLALCGGVACADPGYYVVTVYDDPGIRTADFRYWSTHPDKGHAVEWPELGLGWNVNGRWYTEVLASWIDLPGGSNHLSNVEWQNDVLLTQGQYPFDFAIHTLLTAPQRDGGAHTFEFGPVFQTDIERTQLNLNLVFERGYGPENSKPTQLKYQWQVRYRWNRGLHFGAQGFGELGTWNDWSRHQDQSHRAGPALFGTLPGGPGTVSWQAAWLEGKTYGRRGSMFTARLKYEY